MNLPNRLTLLRLALVPIFVALLLADFLAHHGLWALLVFALASLTDLLDGRIARRRNLVTTFGKLMDPLADKVLVMAAMLCLVERGHAPSYVVILILAREFLVTSLRLVAAGEGLVIAADRWGKVKTVVQMLWIIAALLLLWVQADLPLLSAGILAALRAVSAVLMWASVFFTLLSGFRYAYSNRQIFLREL
jgi:CDP-diacylglycerol--glycerol-3-phosphate 3-phosphatidyltransferase